MARFCDVIGYGESVETAPGVWEDLITEMTYYGDVIRNSRRTESGEGVLDDVRVNNSISIVADEFAIKHFSIIKYVRWTGELWTITSVESRPPRLILNLGGVYNGPTP